MHVCTSPFHVVRAYYMCVCVCVGGGGGGGGAGNYTIQHIVKVL